MGKIQDPKDCYVVQSSGRCLGPMTVAEVKTVIRGITSRYLLLRAGCPPIRSEDIEGLSLVLATSAKVKASPPYSQFPRGLRDLFDGSLAFDVDATAHYQQHKSWFEVQRIHGQTRKNGSKSNQFAPLSEVSIPGVQGRGKAGPGRFAKIKSKAGTILAGLIVGIGITVGSAGVLQTRGIRFWFDPVKPQSAYESLEFEATDNSAAAPSGVAMDRPGRLTSLSARSANFSVHLTQAVAAKIQGDPVAYTQALLSLVPFHKRLGTPLPEPEVAMAFALAFLDEQARTSHPAWEPMARLVGGDPKLGLPGLALVARQIVDQASVFMGSNAVTSASSAFEVLRNDLLAGAAMGPDVFFWGHRSSFDPLSLQVRDGSNNVLALIAKLPELAATAGREPTLRSYLVTKALAASAIWFAGLDNPQLGRNLKALFPPLQGYLGAVDLGIIRSLMDDASTPFSLSAVPIRIAARFDAFMRLQAEHGVLCSKGKSLLAQDQLMQMLRMATLAGVEVPNVNKVDASCWIQPQSTGLSRSTSVTMGAGLLGFVPAVAAAMGPAFTGAQSPLFERISEQQPGVSLWLGLAALASRDRALRHRTSTSVLESMPGCEGWEARTVPGSATPLRGLCLQFAWNALDRAVFTGRLGLLERIQSEFGRKAAEDAFLQWLTDVYMFPRVLPSMPPDPRAFAERVGLGGFLNAADPTYETLQWFGRNGVVE